MLVLTRKVGQQIRIGEDVVVTVVRIQGDKVRLGIEAPSHVVVHREEVRQRLRAAAIPAAAGAAGPFDDAGPTGG